MNQKVVLISGTSSGFGADTAQDLAAAGHIVYAGMRGIDGHNAEAAQRARARAQENSGDLRPIELDVVDQDSVEACVAEVIARSGRVDVLVHNAGHMVLGPAEAFTPEQLAETYDINVVSTQRLNRAVLPYMRAQRDGLLVWVGSSSTRGGTPPYLAPYFAAKAGEDALAVSYSVELSRFGIESTIIVPGSFTTGTNHFAHAGAPQDTNTEQAYETEYAGLMDQVNTKLADLAPDDADPTEIGRAIARVVDTPKGQRPFRVHIDPANDGAETVNAVADRIRTEFYERIDLADLLHPATS